LPFEKFDTRNHPQYFVFLPKKLFDGFHSSIIFDILFSFVLKIQSPNFLPAFPPA